MRRRFTAYLRSATLKAEAPSGHLKSGGPAFEMTTSLPPTFVSSRSMSGRTLSGSPNAGPRAFIKDLVVHPYRCECIAQPLDRRRRLAVDCPLHVLDFLA